MAIGILIGGAMTYLIHIPLIRKFEKDLDWAYKDREDWVDKAIKAKERHVTTLKRNIEEQEVLYSRIHKLEEKRK